MNGFDPEIRTTRRRIMKVAAGGIALGAAGLREWSPILAQEASPVPGAVVDRLFETFFPASTFPEPIYYAGFIISTEEPASSTTYEMPGNVCQVNYVFEGTLTIEAGGAARIVRNDGAIEEIRADDSVTLDVGDTRVIFDHSRPQVYANTGPEPNRWTYCPIGVPSELEIAYTGSRLIDEAIVVLTDDEWMSAGLGGKGILARLERITIPYGGVYEFPVDTHPVMRILDAGRVDIVITRLDGTMGQPINRGPAAMPSLMIPNAASITMTGVTPDQGPTVLYAYSLQPMDDGVATPDAD
jgi:hypothetical protein